MPNCSSLAGLEVFEKFVVGWGGGVVEHVTTMSNSNAFAELRWVLTIKDAYLTTSNSIKL